MWSRQSLGTLPDMDGDPHGDEELFGVLEDLESQAEALYDAERGADLADRSRAEYASVTLASRLMASVGQEIGLVVRDVGPVAGTVERVADGWCEVARTGQQWVLPLAAVVSVTGGSPRSVPEAAWSPVARLRIGSALRRLADARAECRIHLLGGGGLDGRLERVGADFVEVVPAVGPVVLVHLAGLAAVQHRDD